MLRDVPAWLISLLLHMVMITLMGLIVFESKTEGPFILLSTSVSRERDEGEFKTTVDKNDELKFDLPIPDNINLKNKKLRDALVEADKQAHDLQLDPDVPVAGMGDISPVKALVASDDPVRRTGLAVRDPRLRVEIAKKEGGTTMTEAAVTHPQMAGVAAECQRELGRPGRRELADAAVPALLPFWAQAKRKTPAVIKIMSPKDCAGSFSIRKKTATCRKQGSTSRHVRAWDRVDRTMRRLWNDRRRKSPQPGSKSG